jgi:FkbM family methyltransferase
MDPSPETSSLSGNPSPIHQHLEILDRAEQIVYKKVENGPDLNAYVFLPENHQLYTFVRKFVGVETRDNTIRLEDWVNGQSLPEQGDLILQMDIEGAEYAVLLDCPRDLLTRFRIIIVEFHALDMLFSKKPFEIVKQAFAKLLRDFSVVHLHPNNRADILSNNGIDVPQAMEFTFYRNDRVKLSQAKPGFPHALDSPNDSERPRVVLPRCWW